MYCGNCGNKVPDGAKFCPFCGAFTDDTSQHAPVTADPVSASAEEVSGQIFDAVRGDLSGLQSVMKGDLRELSAAIGADSDAGKAVREAARGLEMPSMDPNVLLGELSDAAGEPYLQGTPVPEVPQLQMPDPAAFTDGPEKEDVPRAPQSPPAPAIRIESGKKKSGRGVITALLIIAALAVGFLVFWNLPGTRYDRYMSKAIDCIGSGDLEGAADLYLRCYELRPDNIRTMEAILAVRTEEEMLSEDAMAAREYEEALVHAKNAYRLYVGSEAGSDDAQFTLASVYYEWGRDLARQGDASAESMIQRAAGEGLSEKYTEMVRMGVLEGRELYDIEIRLDEAAAAACAADIQKDYAAAFGALRGVIGDLIDYGKKYGGMFPAVSDNGANPVYWTYDESSNCVQMRIGGLRQGEASSTFHDTYFITGASYSTHSYEFFSSEWRDGAPDGEFYEIDFSGMPEAPNETNCVIVTGKVADSLYDGDISHVTRGRTYLMKFVKGKVQVLDTLDPNGEEKNVVGYTEDRSGWVSYKDEQLNGNYGIRCLDIPET